MLIHRGVLIDCQTHNWRRPVLSTGAVPLLPIHKLSGCPLHYLRLKKSPLHLSTHLFVLNMHTHVGCVEHACTHTHTHTHTHTRTLHARMHTHELTWMHSIHAGPLTFAYARANTYAHSREHAHPRSSMHTNTHVHALISQHAYILGCVPAHSDLHDNMMSMRL